VVLGPGIAGTQAQQGQQWKKAIIHEAAILSWTAALVNPWATGIRGILRG
jgi:hypothetical protein